MKNDFTWWRKALANPAMIGFELPVNQNEPQHGYYRMKSRNGTFVPVAIYPDDGELFMQIGESFAMQAEFENVWTRCCRYPVSFATYTSVVVDHQPWPDLDEGVTESLRGHNLSDDPVASLQDQVNAALAGIDAYKVITDDEMVSRAQSLRSRLLELSKQADKEREVEKKPHLEAGRAVDAKWQPIVKGAELGATKLRGAMSVYETAKLQAARRAAADAAAREPAKPAPEPVPDKGSVRGGYGRAAAVRTKRVATEITDYNQLWVLLAGHPEMDALMLKLAQKLLDQGVDVDGVKIEEIADVR